MWSTCKSGWGISNAIFPQLSNGVEPMRYFIEVMYKHSLFFATALDSIEDEYKLRAVLETFVKKFPVNEGYEVKGRVSLRPHHRPGYSTPF
jgi:hypothetical protein